jgi:hypothetical protein
VLFVKEASSFSIPKNLPLCNSVSSVSSCLL